MSVSLSQEVGIGIRAVDANVAIGAVLETGIEHVVSARLGRDAAAGTSAGGGAVMTFEAHGEDDGPAQ